MNVLKRCILIFVLSLAAMTASGNDMTQEVKDMFDNRRDFTHEKLMEVRNKLSDHHTRRLRLNQKALSQLDMEHTKLKNQLLKIDHMRKKEIERIASLNGNSN